MTTDDPNDPDSIAQRTEQAFEHSDAAKQAIAEQHAVQERLTLAVLAREKAQLETYNANKNMTGLPAAPKMPATMEGTQQQINAGKTALKAYKDAGFLANPENAPAPSMQASAADHALSVEKEFRDRQQQLADRITNPKTNLEERTRLELVKTTEYHNHKAAQMERIVELQTMLDRQSGGNMAASEQLLRDRQHEIDHHKQQAALAAQQLHTFDLVRNAVPKEVQARMGHAAQQPQIQHNEQNQKDLSRDPHLQAIANGMSRQDANQEQAQAKLGQEASARTPEAPNPAAARLAARLQAARERNDASTTPELDARVQEIGTCRDKLAAAQEMRKTEALGQKAELEQRAARHH